MAFPAYVNSASGLNYTGTNVPTLATGSLAMTAGNLIVVFVRNGPVTGVTDALGNIYTLRATDTGTLRIYSCANCVGGSSAITATFTAPTPYVSIVAMQFSGMATASELIGAFTTAAVTSGTIIDLAYNTGGFFDALVVGVADIFNNGSFTFTGLVTDSPVAYVEPVADHNSAAFFYRLPGVPLSADTVRATLYPWRVPEEFVGCGVEPTSTTGGAARVTQLAVETLTHPTPDARVGQLVVETLSNFFSEARVTPKMSLRC